MCGGKAETKSFVVPALPPHRCAALHVSVPVPCPVSSGEDVKETPAWLSLHLQYMEKQTQPFFCLLI